MKISIDQISSWIVQLRHNTFMSKWKLSIDIDWWFITMKYKRDGKEILMIRDIKDKKNIEIYNDIREFVIDIYYEYERDWKTPLSAKQLWNILWIKTEYGVRMFIYRILWKLNNEQTKKQFY